MGQMITISDNNFHEFINPEVNGEVKRCSRMPRMEGYGALPYATPFNVPIIPKPEWAGLIAKMTAEKSRLSDLIRHSGMPPLDQDGTNYCLLPETMILMRNEPNKQIQHVKPGDSVISAEGNKQCVTHVMARWVKEPLVELFVENSRLKLTGGHPVLTEKHGYLPAWSLKPEMYINYGEGFGRGHSVIKAIERVPYSGPVYNLEVSVDNSYVADHVGVHNCWGNGPVNCVRVLRAVSNEPFVELSPASVCAPITNFRNDGGWGTTALKYIVEHGVASAALWPPNAINKKYWTAEEKADAATRKVTEWWDLKPRNFEQLATCLLLRIPVAVGFDFWSHEVMAVDLVSENSILIWNSWGASWSDFGFGILTGSKALPDDAVAPRVSMAVS